MQPTVVSLPDSYSNHSNNNSNNNKNTDKGHTHHHFFVIMITIWLQSCYCDAYQFSHHHMHSQQHLYRNNLLAPIFSEIEELDTWDTETSPNNVAGFMQGCSAGNGKPQGRGWGVNRSTCKVPEVAMTRLTHPWKTYETAYSGTVREWGRRRGGQTTRHPTAYMYWSSLGWYKAAIRARRLIDSIPSQITTTKMCCFTTSLRKQLRHGN